MIGMRCVYCGLLYHSILCLRPSNQQRNSHIISYKPYINISVRDMTSVHQLIGFALYGGSTLPRILLHSTRLVETSLLVRDLVSPVALPFQKITTL